MSEPAQRISCPSCKYDLRTHVTDGGATCPECGCAVSPDDLRPDCERQGPLAAYFSRWKRVLLALVFAPPLVFAVMMAVSIAVGTDGPPTWTQDLFFAMLLAVFVVQVAVPIGCGARMDPPWPWWRGLCVGVGVIAVFVVLQYVTSFIVLIIMMNIML